MVHSQNGSTNTAVKTEWEWSLQSDMEWFVGYTRISQFKKESIKCYATFT